MRKVMFLALVFLAGAGVFLYDLKSEEAEIFQIKEKADSRTEESFGFEPEFSDSPAAAVELAPKAVFETDVSFSNLNPEQGDSAVIKIRSEFRPEAVFRGERIGFLEVSKNNWLGVLGVDAKAASGRDLISISFGDGGEEKREISIVKKNWPVTKLVLNENLKSQGYTPESVVSGVQVNENAAIREAAGKYSKPKFSGRFADPLPAKRVAGLFGNIRKSGKTGIQHLGVDLEAEKGDAVSAINDGEVVLAREDFPNYGKTVVIDHGLGIFSLYLHLSEIKVSMGQKVAKGETVGLVGNTGYSLEPHLHFSIRVGAARVDPLKFIDEINAGFDF